MSDDRLHLSPDLDAARPPPARRDYVLGRHLDGWPSCPDCGTPWLTRCPICRTTGAGFTPADPNYYLAAAREDTGMLPAPEDGTGEAPAPRNPPGPAVLCPICLEPFEMEFLHRCPECGHQYGEAIEPEGPEEPIGEDRALIMLLLTILVVAGLTGFLATLWQTR